MRNASNENLREDDDECIFYPVEFTSPEEKLFQAFTMYKHVDKKIKPVSTTFSPDHEVRRTIPEDPLLTLPKLTETLPEFQTTARITQEPMNLLEINNKGYLSKEEEKLFKHMIVLNQDALAFEDSEQGMFKDSYFSPYKIPTVPHMPWEYKNMTILPGLLTKVIEVLKLKVEAGVYEPCQSSS
jgi:hypothetical protein